MSETITIEREGEWYIITDESTSVTTQGRTKSEALLMLVDALAAHHEADVDLMELAADVFVADEDTEEFLDDLPRTDGGHHDPHDVPGHGRAAGIDDPVPRAQYGDR